MALESLKAELRRPTLRAEMMFGDEQAVRTSDQIGRCRACACYATGPPHHLSNPHESATANRTGRP